MTKRSAHESAREEAARMDGLDAKGALDDLPFTRLRRYAKEPSQVYAIRIPVSRLRAIRWLADRRREQPTALLREWVLERLDDELARTEATRVGEQASAYAVSDGLGRETARPKRSPARSATKRSPRKTPTKKK